ncbi:MAG: T9SS type A sorting domain-containing protein [Ignavibacteriae bacterium]|nr:T9SS type A sorting domain-containing protein [Ignavibacteriota bacterium]
MKKVLLLEIILLLYFSNCFSQSAWQWSYPKPQGNSTYCSWFFNSNTGFIGTTSGTIMKTTNGGINWKYVLISPGNPLGIGNTVVDIDFINSLTGFAINTKELYKTINGGENWFYVDTLNYYTGRISFINSYSGFFVGFYGPVSKTTDGGHSWINLNVGSSVFVDVKFINENTGFISSDSQRVYRTTNSGVNWQIIYSGYSNGFVDYFTFYNQNNGLGIIYGGKFIKTTNAGQNWVQGSMSSTYNMYSAVYKDSLNIFMFGENGLFHKTTNGGLNWTTNYVWADIPTIQTTQVINCNDIFVAGRWGFIAKSTNLGNNWTLLSQLVNEGEYLNTIAFASQQIGFAGGNLFLKTTDGGVNWEKLSHPWPGIRNFNFINSNTGFIASISSGVYKTTNSGTNWQQIYPYYPLYISYISFLNENTGLATLVDGFIARTTNGGFNWTKVDSAGTIFYSGIYFKDANTGFAFTQNGILKRTSNAGINWQNVYTSGLLSLNSICFKNNSTGFIGCENNTLLKTTNGGLNWSPVILPLLFNSSIYQICFGNQNTGLLIHGSNISRIMTTTDGGNNWIYSSCLTENNLTALCSVDSAKYFIGSYNGSILYTITAGIVGIYSAVNEITTEKFLLLQNYPNPFNPSTNIRYRVPSGSITNNRFVLLKIYDVTGKEITTLVNEKQSPGTYEIKFEAGDLPSGVYFYKLAVGDYSEAKKMILIK